MDDRPRKEASRRSLRWLRITLWTAFGAYLALALAQNILLATRALSRLASEGDGKSFNIRYDSAWSWIPGVVHLRGLRLDGTDPNVHWEVRLARARFGADLRRLPFRELRIRRLEAEDGEVSVVEHPPERRAQILARLREGELPGPLPPKESWRIKIENVDLRRMGNIRVNDLRFAGDSDIGGGFFLRPGRHLVINGGFWEIRSGRVRSGDIPLFRDPRARAVVDVHPTDLLRVHGNQIFRTMDIALGVRTPFLDPEMIATLLRDYRPLRSARADGELALRFRALRGIVQPESAIEGAIRELRLRFPDAELSFRGELSGGVGRGRLANEGRLEFVLRDLDWRMLGGARGKGRPLLRGNAVGLSAVFPNLDLGYALSSGRGISIRAQGANLRVGRSGDVVHHLLGFDAATFPADSRRGTLAFSASLDPSRAVTAASFVFREPAFRFQKDPEAVLAAGLRASVGGQLTGNPGAAWKDRALKAEVQVELSDAELRRKGVVVQREERWSMGLRMADGALSAPNRPFLLAGEFDLRLSDLQLPTRVATEDSFWMNLATALYPMRSFDGVGDLSWDARRFRVDRFVADSSSGRITAGASEERGIWDGRLHFGFFPMAFCYRFGGEDAGMRILSSARGCLGNFELTENREMVR